MQPDEEVCFVDEFDGIVVESQTLRVIDMDVRYWKFKPGQTIYLYNILKKHLELPSYTQNARMLLKETSGIVIFAEFGWQICLGLVPIPSLKIDAYYGELSKIQTKILSKAKQLIEKKLIDLCHMSTVDVVIKPTLKKNRINNIQNCTLEPEDRAWFLEQVDLILKDLHVPEGLEIKIFSFRFGERRKGEEGYDARIGSAGE